MEPLDQQTVWLFISACSVCTEKTVTTQVKPSDKLTVWTFSNVFPSVYQINRQCGFSAMCFPVCTRYTDSGFSAMCFPVCTRYTDSVDFQQCVSQCVPDTQTVRIFSNVFPSVYQINGQCGFSSMRVPYVQKNSNRSNPQINRQCVFSAMCFPVCTR